MEESILLNEKLNDDYVRISIDKLSVELSGMAYGSDFFVRADALNRPSPAVNNEMAKKCAL